jgi:hypothetical protein
MILPGHTLSELRWQNRAARTRTAPRNKKSGRGTGRTKKGRAEAPCQNVTITLVLSTAAGVASCEAQGYMKSLALKRVGTEVAKRGRL